MAAHSPELSSTVSTGGRIDGSCSHCSADRILHDRILQQVAVTAEQLLPAVDQRALLLAKPPLARRGMRGVEGVVEHARQRESGEQPRD